MRLNIMSELIPKSMARRQGCHHVRSMYVCYVCTCVYVHTSGLYSTLATGAGGRQPPIEIRCPLSSRYEKDSNLSRWSLETVLVILQNIDLVCLLHRLFFGILQNI